MLSPALNVNGPSPFARLNEGSLGARTNIPSKKTEPMNEQTSLSPNLLQADARARKQIPIAVFAVIAIHVVLFLSLLGTSGCKQKASASDAEKFKTTEYNKAQPSAASTPATAANNETRAAAPEQLQTETVSELPNNVAPPSKPAAPAAKSKGMKKGSEVMAEGGDSKTHVVRQGESLYKIAKLYNTTPKALKVSNNLKGDTIRVGQKLRISS